MRSPRTATKSSPCSLQLEKARAQQRRPNAAKIKKRERDLIPGRGAKIPHASQPKNQNIKQKQYCNKCNKDFKKWSTSKKILKKKKNSKE